MRKMKSCLIISLVLFFSYPLLASFEETNRRYLSTIDIIIKLESTFPVREWKTISDTFSIDTTVKYCSDLGANYQGTRKSAFGANFSGTGEPGTPFHGASFLDEYIPCVKNFISSDLHIIDLEYSKETVQASDLPAYKEIVSSYLPEDYIHHLQKKFIEEGQDQYRIVPGNPQAYIHHYKELELNSPWIDRIIEYNIHRILGPEPVIKSFGFVSSKQEIVDFVKSNLGNFTHPYNHVYNIETQETEQKQMFTIRSVLQATLLLLTTREEFLTY